ncbi:unnamed protein product [Discosporangium mesarthrocarpum]
MPPNLEEPSGKRHRRGDDMCQGVAMAKRLFLPVHLCLLRALYEDDGRPRFGSTDPAAVHARPPWGDIEAFLRNQASILDMNSQVERASMVLRVLGNPDTPSGAHPFRENRSSHHENHSVSPQFGVGGTRGLCRETHPRAVVCGVVRRACHDNGKVLRKLVVELEPLREFVVSTIHGLEVVLGIEQQRTATAAGATQRSYSPAMQSANAVAHHTATLVLWRRLLESFNLCIAWKDSNRYRGSNSTQRGERSGHYPRGGCSKEDGGRGREGLSHGPSPGKKIQ